MHCLVLLSVRLLQLLQIGRVLNFLYEALTRR